MAHDHYHRLPKPCNTKRPGEHSSFRGEIAGLDKAVPTAEELKKVKAFRDAGKPKTGMTPADLLILELANVPNLKQRLSAMAFRCMPKTPRTSASAH